MPRPLQILHIYAHPDDESFGNPATIAHYAARGTRIDLLTATRGEAGETNGRCPADRLGPVREAELRAACRVLGIAGLALWNLPDGGLADIPDETGIRMVREAIGRFRPSVIVTFGEDGITGHTDHVAISRWTTQAFFEYKKKAGENGLPRLYWRTTPAHRKEALQRPDLIFRNDFTTVIDARAHAAVRTAAEDCHKSQRRHTDYARLTPAGMGGVDYYIRLYPEWKGGPLEADLFGGLYHSPGSTFP
ncbi:MAG: PIG-L family deacetylase [bacterium]|nr:PIG-L family deacetylase [bacterium]